MTSDVSLLGPAEIRQLAAQLGIRPTKRWGQNFVVDANTVRRIVRTSGVTSDDIVVEIGPGLGSLTLALLPYVARVVAVEIDPILAAQLPKTVAAHAGSDHADRLDVVHADALTYEGTSDATALVANLPYNVAVPVLLRAFETLRSLRYGLVMVQSEVADRLVAPPGSRTYGVPSVKTAWWASARRAGAVSRSVFWPVPNVDSGLVTVERRDPPATTASRQAVFALVDAAFAQRRKSLRAALGGWAGSPAAAEDALRKAGIDPSTRGEALSVEDFARLAEHRPPVRSSA